jgi:thymidine phosphorylase
LVLDVKVGRAAFMRTYEDAKALAQSMVQAGAGNGVNTVAVMTSMDDPIGRLIGNSLEVIETIETLKGNGPADLLELTAELGGQLLLANGNAATIEEAREKILSTFKDGSALEKFRQMMVAQGATEQVAQAVCDDPWAALPIGVTKTTIKAPSSGFVSAIDAMPLAICTSELGGGRAAAGDIIDFGVGIQILAQVGESVTAGEPMMVVFHNKAISAAQADSLRNAVSISDAKPEYRSRIVEIIRP